MIALDNIRIRRGVIRWSARLRILLQPLWRWPRPRVRFRLSKGVCGAALLSWELARRRLTAHRSVVHMPSMSRSWSWAPRDNVVRYCAIAPLSIVHRFVPILIWVLYNDVPGVEEAREKPEDGEGDVDDAVGTADAALNPY